VSVLKEFTNLAEVPYKVILLIIMALYHLVWGREGRGNNIYTPNIKRHQVPLKKLPDV
jgi:hypothetical protein